MKSVPVRKKSVKASMAGIALLLLCGLGTTFLTPKEVEDVAVENTVPAEEQITKKTMNPFVETMIFERTQTISQGTALVEIKIEPDGQYRIKECISGDILSKGVWQFNDENSTITLTHIGNYPMNNVFKVEPYAETNDMDPMDSELIVDNEGNVADAENEVAVATSAKWQLIFILSESTNLQYEVLVDGDVFAQRDVKTTEPSEPEVQEGVI